MELDRHPFVAAACEDIAEHRTRLITASDLARDHESVQQFDLNLAEAHEVTETFLSLWNNLPTATRTPHRLILSLMHGITIEARHPAYQVTPTGLADVFQAQVGADITLVFRSSSDPSHRAYVWLAVLHDH